MNLKRRLRHPDRVKLGLRKLAAKRREQWQEYLSTRACERCGEANPIVLEHHHLDPSTKRFDLGQVAKHNWTELMREAAKCQVLCANCHRIVEWEKRHGRHSS